jgi:hypothetical protein
MDANDPRMSWLQGLGLTFLAFIAGALGHIMRAMDAGGRVLLWPTVVQACSAGLVGFLVMMLCRSVGLSPEMTSVTVGVSGWLGATATIQALQRSVWTRLGLNQRKEDVNDAR